MSKSDEKKAYISGALTRADDLDKQREFYEKLGEVCRNAGYEPYIPHLNTDPIRAPQVADTEVYQRDFDHVVASTLLVAYIGEPSLGVGTELEIAKVHNISIILLSEQSVRVSRMATGNPAVKENIRFGTREEALELLTVALQRL